ncbi:MAG TPA: hypothetical protein VFA18_08780 [Gemmataceae bacterium]|nr:hypothetical protein [Gemmataceae bacterium]
MHIDHSTILGNQAIGGVGTTGGNGQGGGIANLFGGVLTVTDSVIALNRAIGGAGDGGDGQGGGIFNGAPSRVGTPALTLHHSAIVNNEADGGAAGIGGIDGQGVGGGLYLTPGGIACADLLSVIVGNHASTNDDVFGNLGDC